MDTRFPYAVDSRGRTATASRDDHIRDLIEQILFTSPGERVNRPDFGTGLMQLVFAPGSDEVAATLQMLVRGALQQWLGDRIAVDDVTAESSEGTLRVSVQYTVLLTRETGVADFSRAVAT
jgi:phage baseplate assembly protein W